MPYNPPGITVNQAAPQQQAVLSTSNTRTIGAVFTAPSGPDVPMRIDPSQATLVYGDPTNPANSGFTGPNLLRMIAAQATTNKASSLQIVGMRAGVTRASATITGVTGTNQVTTIAEFTVSSGTFVVTYNGQSTSAQAYNVTTAALQTALQALSTIGAGNVLVTGTAGTSYICTFAGTLANQPLPNFTITPAGIGAGAITSTVTTNGVIGTGFTLQGIGAYAGSKGNNLQVLVNAPQINIVETTRGNSSAPEVQTITIYQLAGSPTGTLTFSWNGSNATGITAANLLTGGAANIQTALQAITGLGAGNILVTQSGGIGVPVPGALTFVCTFAGTKATGNQPLIGVSANTLASGTGTLPVQSVLINDTTTGTPVLKQQLSAGQYDLTTCGKVFQAINNQNPTTSLTSIVQATALAGSAGSLAAQAATAFTGGADGLGVTPGASDVLSPDGVNKTIPYLLSASLNPAIGNVDFIVAGFDAGAIMGSIQTHVANGLNATPPQWRKPYLGPIAGTSYASLSTTYQTANSDRVVIIGHDAVTGTNPTNGTLNFALDGYMVAAAVCAQKALNSPEQNLYNQSINGIAAVTPTPPDLTTPLTTAQLNTLAGAGYTVLQYNTQTGRLAIRDLISTAQQVDNYGQPNRFMYASERDAFDAIALLLYNGLLPLLGSPAQAPSAVQTSFQNAASQIMASCAGRLHNGAVASAAYDPVNLVVTVNIGYLDRPPLNNIVINLAPQAALANS